MITDIRKVKAFGKEFDFSFKNIFPEAPPKGPVSKELRAYRKKRQQRRLVANASRRRNRG